MPGYAKLFASIVHSTIWREKNHVRLVWITMLAIADKNGFVEASVPGLADISRVDLEECQSALDHLAAPDEYSRSQDYGGRRIEPMDGGWLLLNYTKYRGALLEEKIREQNRVRQQRFRASKKEDSNAKVTGNADVTPGNAYNAQSDPSSSSYATKKEKSKKKKPGSFPEGFLDFWMAYPKKKGKRAAFNAWERAKKNGLPDSEQLLLIIEKHVASSDWGKDNGKFIPNPSTWLNQGRWDDEINHDSGSGPGAPQYPNRDNYNLDDDA
jgi:hypothetical protein